MAKTTPRPLNATGCWEECLFNDAVSMSDSVASNHGMNRE
jgi:hypothetical protein